MPVMLEHAKSLGAKRVGIMLPNTGWGRSNNHAFQMASKAKYNMNYPNPIWYNWGEKNMIQFYRQFLKQKVDAIILVANDIEGAILVSQLKKIEPKDRVPIISHWGVTGGKMVEASGPTLHEIDFSVVQTFSFYKTEQKALSKFMKTADKLYGIKRIEEIFSPVGFGHAYDMMHILAKAVEIAGSTERAKVRAALEHVSNHSGLITFYEKPFTAQRHDALSIEQLFMAKYRKDGVIIPIR